MGFGDLIKDGPSNPSFLQQSPVMKFSQLLGYRGDPGSGDVRQIANAQLPPLKKEKKDPSPQITAQKFEKLGRAGQGLLLFRQRLTASFDKSRIFV